MVTDSDLKSFTCPIDDRKCPSGTAAIVMNSKFDTVSSISDTWSGSRIRQLTNCKIQVKHDIFKSGLASKKREHMMYIHLVEATQTGQVQIVELINNDFRTATIQDIASGETKEIKMNVAAGPFGAIKQDKEWWILYNPQKFKNGEIQIKSEIKLIPLPQVSSGGGFSFGGGSSTPSVPIGTPTESQEEIDTATCTDTADWTNGQPTWEMQTCAQYKEHYEQKVCELWVGATYNYPEINCCICGGSSKKAEEAVAAAA